MKTQQFFSPDSEVLEKNPFGRMETGPIPIERGVNQLPNPPCEKECAFSSQEQSNFDSKERTKSMRKLSCLLSFYILVMTAELYGGFKANSLALMADAAHLLADIAGVSISIFAVLVSCWKATPRHSFAFNRLEVLGALMSVQLIWLISGVLIYEATERIANEGTKMNGKVMFAMAAFGFLMNLIMVSWLGHDHDHHKCGSTHDFHDDECDKSLLKFGGIQDSHDHEEKLSDDGEAEENKHVTIKFLNINLQGAYLHVIADLIQSFGVMASGAIIWVRPDWLFIDLLCTFAFAGLALGATLPMLKNIFGVLMESAPDGIDCDKLKCDMRLVTGVQGVHDLHVWAITPGKTVLSCHVVAASGESSSETIYNVADFCARLYGIHHVTIQVE